VLKKSLITLTTGCTEIIQNWLFVAKPFWGCQPSHQLAGWTSLTGCLFTLLSLPRGHTCTHLTHPTLPHWWNFFKFAQKLRKCFIGLT